MCSVLEACLLSLSTTDIASLSEKHRKIADTWRGFKENIQKSIAVILIVNTLANTMGASISGAQFSHVFGNKWVWLYSLAFAAVTIQWSEILPKTLAVRYNRSFAVWVAVPLKALITVLGPMVKLIEFLNRPFAGRRTTQKADAINEIGVLTRFAALNNQITREQEDIVSRSITLSGARVRDIMVERADIKFLSTSMSMVDALIEAHIHHHTRYVLVKDGNLDNVVGYVNVKDIVSALKTNPQNPTLAGIARPVPEIQASDKVPTILKTLVKSYQHIAVAKDEAGKTVGLVTVEDVIEAIVGDIEDEYDVLPMYIHKLSDIRYIVGGGVTLAALRETSGFDLPAEQAVVDTWLTERFGRKPAIEGQFTHNDCAFTIRKMRRSRIHEVIVEKKSALMATPSDVTI
jgi:CBS domain containing-hemolysin-like protein